MPTRLDGERGVALEALREALAVGWAHARIFSDHDLDSLRGDTEFESIAEEVRSRIERRPRVGVREGQSFR